MLNVVLPTRKSATPRVWHALAYCLILALCSLVTAGAQEEPASNKNAPPSKTGTAKPGVPKNAGKAAEPAAGAPNAADPSQTRKIAPTEVFRDQRAEQLLSLEKLKAAPPKPVSNTDVLELKAQAGGVNVNLDKELIARVVQGMAAKLTDRANVQALVDPPANQKPDDPKARAIQEATTTLLEPIFMAKSIKNQSFLRVYYGILRAELMPLLRSNHLVPRVQAMIILGESGSADFMPIYLAQIRDKTQTVWVKLWALEGLVNMVDEGGRLNAQDQIVAAKTVADFLETESDLPWPAQLRGLEVLSAMRQGYEANRPQKAAMANAAMGLLADGSAKLEVRSEAARALGQMPMSAAVAKYNYQLVAHSAGQVAAELGSRVSTVFTANQDKAKYWTALLIGPVYQAFDGVPGARDSGLLHATTGPPAAYVQKVFNFVKPIVQASIDLLSAGQRQIQDRKKELTAHVAALKDFLDKNPPPDRHLVPDGAAFPLALLPGSGLGLPPAPLAGQPNK